MEQTVGLGEIRSVQPFGEGGNETSKRLDLVILIQVKPTEGEERLQFERPRMPATCGHYCAAEAGRCLRLGRPAAQ